ncbi:hypothetical protein Calkro_2537 [Caldicellulosiruptor kronotskyensis 2002]|uniref:Uncharacterized protein n=1 Tax=Caldicellulosiruptor kronotskyensis (strain DSM 18902 / VKM B-2412 / 2002) TaxID=632348 RepID=E4SHW2_CALK2|nr:hypothetical protein [Caldicellulosiruptor kronotskyensis]ADQ47337.1 hypothetical protein Calkro_2537 [Caldicellulosiruptor kronotskyensis 2002]
MQLKSLLEKFSSIRVRQYVLQEEGLNSWWDFRMPIEDYYTTLFELVKSIKRARLVFKALMACKRYFRIIPSKKGLCLVYRFSILSTAKNPELPVDINQPTEIIEYNGIKWFVEEFGSLIVIGEVDVNKVKRIVEKLEENWKKRYPKIREREIKKYIDRIKNENIEEMSRIWDAFVNVVNEN